MVTRKRQIMRSQSQVIPERNDSITNQLNNQDRVASRAYSEPERRPSVFQTISLQASLNEEKTVAPVYNKLQYLGGFLTTLTIIASLVSAIMLIVTRSTWDDFLTVQYPIPFFSVALLIASVIRVSTFLAQWTLYAQKNLSKERNFLNKSFVSTFFTLHLMPLVMIDESWDPVNPVFGKSYNNLVYVPLTIINLYAALVIAWIILWLIGRKLDSQDYKRFAEILSKSFRAISWFLCILGIFTIFVILTAISSEIPLIYIELFASVYYLLRASISAYMNNRLCWKYTNQEKLSYARALSSKRISEIKSADEEIMDTSGQMGTIRLRSSYQAINVPPTVVLNDPRSKELLEINELIVRLDTVQEDSEMPSDEMQEPTAATPKHIISSKVSVLPGLPHEISLSLQEVNQD